MKLVRYKGIRSNGSIVKKPVTSSTNNTMKYTKKHLITCDTTYCMMCSRHTCKAIYESAEKPRSSKALKKNKFYHKHTRKWLRKSIDY